MLAERPRDSSGHRTATPRTPSLASRGTAAPGHTALVSALVGGVGRTGSAPPLQPSSSSIRLLRAAIAVCQPRNEVRGSKATQTAAPGSLQCSRPPGVASHPQPLVASVPPSTRAGGGARVRDSKKMIWDASLMVAAAPSPRPAVTRRPSVRLKAGIVCGKSAGERAGGEKGKQGANIERTGRRHRPG